MRLLLIIAVLAVTFGISSAVAAKRVALVIGNDSYKTLTKLNNARKDAKDMAGKLKELGWEVILETDVGRRKMGRAIGKFGGLLANAEAGLVFYAGHGIQSKGENWLIPSNAEVETEGDLEYEAVALSKIMNEMEASGVNLNIVVLDACRDNPLPKHTRSATRGLSISPTPQGMKSAAIVYSAAPGQTAQDGPTGGNGIFTGELLNILDEPGLKLVEVFKKTAQQVAARTNNKQKPWINSSFTGDFYFNEAVAPAAVTEKAAPQQSTTKSSGGVTQDTKKKEEMLLWETVKDSNDASMYKEYLQGFPNGTFAAIARIKLAGLQKVQSIEKKKAKARKKAEAALKAKIAASQKEIAKQKRLAAEERARLLEEKKALQREVAKRKRLTELKHQQMAVLPPSAAINPSTKATLAVGVNRKRYKPGETFKDCDTCPEMIVIPPGSFRMGDLSGAGKDRERPVHEVRLGYRFAVGKYEVTRGEFAKFIAETNRYVDKSCYVSTNDAWEKETGGSWGEQKSSSSDRDPVGCLNWNDAQAYVNWMSRKTGKQYRLLSEAEWEYMARAGSNSKYPFGSSEVALCEHGNGADQSTSLFRRNDTCSDGSGEKAVKVGSYKANKFGVYDTVGNVWEWVADCWHLNYNNAPNDGSAWTSGGDCSKRLLRGGSYDSKPKVLRSANRDWDRSKDRDKDNGLRIARTLPR